MLSQFQGTKDIMREILATHEQFKDQYDLIYDQFDDHSIIQICKNLWEFLKWNFPYVAESSDSQSVRSPSAIIMGGAGLDCKHYSLFIAGVMDAFYRNSQFDFEWYFLFVSEERNGHIGHVFVEVIKDGHQIWVDPVLSYFNQGKEYTKIVEKNAMSLYQISGVMSNPPTKEITVALDKAGADFLTMVNLNLFSLKDLLKKNSEITNTAVRAYFEANDLPFQNLIAILNS